MEPLLVVMIGPSCINALIGAPPGPHSLKSGLCFVFVIVIAGRW
jgi:hypothetical protein